MAPVLLDALADDQITLDQLQALSATEDHQRQCDVWENAHGWAAAPQHLREAVLKGEVSAKDNNQLAFVGREIYEAAGGTFKFDLFTDEGFLIEPAMLERLAREKLHALAQQVAEDEGWSWAEGRIRPLKRGVRMLFLAQARNAKVAPASRRVGCFPPRCVSGEPSDGRSPAEGCS